MVNNTTTNDNPYKVTTVDVSQDADRYKDSGERRSSRSVRDINDWRLKEDGYSVEARPYDFKEEAFQDPNSAKWQEQLTNRLDQVDNRMAPQVMPYEGSTPTVQAIDQSQAVSDQARAQQMQMIQSLQGQYQNQAAGNQVSVGEMAIGMQRDQALNNALAIQSSARGGNVAAASRQAGNSMNQASSDFMQQAGVARAAEAQQANQNLMALGDQYGNVRSQDIGIAQTNQGYANQAELSNQNAELQMLQNRNQMDTVNLQAQMQQGQMNDQMTQYFMSQGMTLDQAQMQASMQLEQLRAQQHQTAQQTNAGLTAAEMAQPDKTGQIVGSVISGVGAVGAMFSDENVKTDIERADSDVNDFLDKLDAYKYKYTKEDYGDTQNDVYGIMAQDLEKSNVGKSLVNETQEGIKTVDTIKGFGAVLAATKALHSRLKDLEGKK